jgi:hypothetical protein
MSAIIHLLEHYISAGLAYVFAMIYIENEIGAAFRA